MQIAIFDFDGTFTTKDTFILFVKFSKGKLNFYLGLFRNFLYLTCLLLNILPRQYVKQKLFSYYFKGMPIQKFNCLCIDFINEIDKYLNSKVILYLNNHLLKGHEVIIISASIENWIIPWATKYKFSKVLATQIEIKEGKVSGNFSSKNCYGPEKLNRFKEIYNDSGKYEIWAYGDSNGDAQILEFATHKLRV